MLYVVFLPRQMCLGETEIFWGEQGPQYKKGRYLRDDRHCLLSAQ